MKRFVILLLVSVVLGCMTAIGAAIWFGLSTDFIKGAGYVAKRDGVHYRHQRTRGVCHYACVLDPLSATDWVRAAPAEAFARFQREQYSQYRPPTLGYSHFARVDVEPPAAAVVAWGWPAPSLVGFKFYAVPSSDEAWALRSGRSPESLARSVPTSPLWAGLAINSVVFTLPFLFVALLPFAARRSVRWMKGRCSSCGYDIRHLDVPRCPECGSAFRLRLRTRSLLPRA